ncbi:MAG: peptidylprolyl isomerase [Pseudomonadales bacterium]|nr:peptidylprolyl isomerase [Pseudomonadales bacterium]
MLIEKNRVVSFHYSLSETGGGLLEDSLNSNPVLYLHGAGGLIPGLAEAMEGHAVGDSFTVDLPPEKAYGFKRNDAVQRVPVKHLVLARKKQKLMPGMIVGLNTEQGVRDVRVIKPGKFTVDVDTNHPLAGLYLTFAINIVDVREATPEEISHGHVHGPGGHQH